MSTVSFNMTAPVFSGKIEDWSIFREQVMNYFTHCKLLYTIDPTNPLVVARGLGVHVKVEGDDEKKEDVVKQETKILDDKNAAYCILYNSVTSGGNKSVINNITFVNANDDQKMDDVSISSRIVTRGDPKRLWDVLCGMYTDKKTTQPYKFGELTKLMTDGLQRNESVMDFANRLRNYQRVLAVMGNKVPDDTLVFYLLKGIDGHSKFATVNDSLVGDDEKTFDQVVARLKTYEDTKSSFSSSRKSSSSEVVDLTDQANYVKGKFRPSGHKFSGRGKFRSFSGSIKCFECGEFGHKAVECPKKKEEDHKGSRSYKQSGQSTGPRDYSRRGRSYRGRGKGYGSGPRSSGNSYGKFKGRSMYSYADQDEQDEDCPSENEWDESEVSHYSYYTGQGAGARKNTKHERRQRC